MLRKSNTKRRLSLLAQILDDVHGRHDQPLPLTSIASHLDIGVNAFGKKVVYPLESADHSASELVYDLNTLVEEGFLSITFFNTERDEFGGSRYSGPGVKVTMAGLEAVDQFRKSWLATAIEKQPITFAQVVLSAVFFILSAGGGWLYGHNSADSTECGEAELGADSTLTTISHITEVDRL